MSDKIEFDPLAAAVAAGRRLEGPVLVLLVSAAGFYTWRGVSLIEPEGDLLSRAGCALVAASVGAALYVLWRAVLSEVPLYSPEVRRRAWPIVAVIAVFAVGTSTFFNASGLFGREAIERRMTEQVELLADSLPKAKAAADAGLAGRQVLAMQAQKFAAMSTDEHDHGEISHVPGGGAVYGMLAQLATVFQNASQSASDKSAQAITLEADATAKLAALRTLVDAKDTPLPDKVTAFANEAEPIRAEILQLARIEAASDVRDAQKAARETIKPALAADGAVASLQQAAADTLTKQVAQLDSLTKYATVPPPPALLPKPIASVTVYQSVIEHLGDFAPLVLAALLIDLLPVPLLALRVIGQTARDDRTAIPAMLGDLRVADALVFAHVLKRLQDLQPAQPEQPAAPIKYPPLAPDTVLGAFEPRNGDLFDRH